VAGPSGHVGLDFETVAEFYTFNYCDLKIVRFPEVSSLLFGHFSKNATLIDQLSRLLTVSPVQEHYGFLVRKYLTKGGPRKACVRGSEKPQFEPISLIKLADAFLLLLGGSVAAAVSLLASRVKRWRRS
jgi:hypothetical protein